MTTLAVPNTTTMTTNTTYPEMEQTLSQPTLSQPTLSQQTLSQPTLSQPTPYVKELVMTFEGDSSCHEEKKDEQRGDHVLIKQQVNLDETTALEKEQAKQAKAQAKALETKEVKEESLTVSPITSMNDDVIVIKDPIEAKNTNDVCDDVLIIPPKITLDDAKALKKDQAKQAKIQEKEQAKQAKIQEKEQANQAKIQEKEQAKLAKIQEKEQAKQAKIQEKEQAKQAKIQENDNRAKVLKLNREKKKKEQELSDEVFDVKFKALSYADKANIIRTNLPGLMKIVTNEDEAINEIISSTLKKEWKKMMSNMNDVVTEINVETDVEIPEINETIEGKTES